MGIIAELLVEVGANVKPFEEGMAKVKEQSATAGEGVGKFGGLAMGAGLLAAGAVTGIVAFGVEAVKHSEEAGQAAYEMSEKFGLLPTQASAYLAVGAQLGLSNEQVSKSFQFLSKNVSAIALTLEAGGKISKTQGQVYKDLGIDVMDAHGKVKSANELMLEAADAFKGMTDGPEKAALAMKLFGKSGTDMLPMLNEGRAGIEELMKSGKEQGAVMSGPQVEAAHKLYLEHKQLDAAIAGITNQFGTFLMPILIAAIPIVMSVVDSFHHVHEIVTKLQPWFPLIAGGLTVLGGVMAAILIPMFIAWTVATWAQVVALAAQAVALIAATWPILLIILALAAVVAIVVIVIQHWGLVKEKTREIVSAMLGYWHEFTKFFEDLPGTILGFISGFETLLLGAGRSLVRGLVAGVESMGGAIMGAIKNLLPGGSGGALDIALHAAGIPGFAGGGTVPGFPGSPQLILAHGGEEVLNATQQRARGGGGGGDGSIPYVVIQVDGRQLALAMAPHLVDETRLRTGMRQ